MPSLGFSTDFWWVDGSNRRTQYTAAVEYAIKFGWSGLKCNWVRLNSPSAAEVASQWFKDHMGYWADCLGDQGTFVMVVADGLYLDTFSDSGQLVYDTAASVFTGLGYSQYTPRVIFQIGNEPYIGAGSDPNHATLNQTLCDRCVTLSENLKISHPTIQTCMPPLGTWRNNTLAAVKAQTLDNWRFLVSAMNGHDTFDWTSANLYRWDHAGVADLSYEGVRWARRILEGASRILGTQPVIMELGLQGDGEPTAQTLKNVAAVAGRRIPILLWKAGNAGVYDLITSGCMVKNTWVPDPVALTLARFSPTVTVEAV